MISQRWRSKKKVFADYRLAEDGAPEATRIDGAAIFTSTSSIGFLVQACVT